MFENEDNKTPATCSFCGKTEDQVKSMISGPGVYICNECVELAQSIIDTETTEEVKPILYFDEKTNEVKGKCKLKPYKSYFAFEIRDEDK